MSSSTSAPKPTDLGERVAVVENEIGHIKDKVETVEKKVDAGFSSVGEKLDKLNGNVSVPPVTRAQSSTSFLGMNIPGRQGMIWFILGVGFILFMLMSNFPGLGKFLSMVSGDGDKSFVECQEGDDGKMECEGDLMKLVEMVNENANIYGDIHGGSHVDRNKASGSKTAKASGAIVLPEEKFEVEDEEEAETSKEEELE